MKCLPSKYVKYNKHKHKKNKWITNGIIRSIKFRDNLYRQLKHTVPGSQEYHTLKTNLRTYNNILRNSIRIAKTSYFNSCFQKFRNDIKKTWTTINDIMNKNNSSKSFPSHFVDRNRLITNKKDIANSFNDYLINIGPSLTENIETNEHISHKDYLETSINHSFKFDLINETQVMKIIDNLPNKSSYGYDNLSLKLM